MFQIKTLIVMSLSLLLIVTGCGADNTNLAFVSVGKVAPSNPKNGEDDKGLGLSNGNQSDVFLVKNPWFTSRSDGSAVTGQTDMSYDIKNSHRPVGMDKFMSSFVSIEDAETGQKCSGSRVVESFAVGVKSVFILTAAHCFSKHDKIGRKILGLNRNISFSVWDYEPRVITSSTSSGPLYYRVYRKIESSKKVYSNKPVFQFGSGDVVMIAIEEKINDSNPLINKSIEICPKPNKLEVTRSDSTARLMLGSQRWDYWNTEPFDLLIYRPMYQGKEKFGGIGDSIFNGDGMYNMRLDILRFLSQSASFFGADLRYNTADVRNSLANGEIPTPVQDSRALMYSFTDFASNSGVGAGDSGLPIIEGRQSVKKLLGFQGVSADVPLFTELNCVSGVLVREYWDNPYGSSGASPSSRNFRTLGGVGTGVVSTSIIQPLSKEDGALWKQVYPRIGESYLVAVQGKEVFTRQIEAIEPMQKAEQVCTSMLGKFTKWGSESAQNVECKLYRVNSDGSRSDFGRVANFELPLGFGQGQN